MDRNRIVTLALVGSIVVIAVLGWIGGVSPLLDQVSAVEKQRASILASNDVNELRVIALKREFEDIGALQTQLSSLRTSVPKDADIPVFLREINTFCAQFGVSLTSVTVGDLEEYVAPIVEVVPDAAATPAPAAGAAVPTVEPIASPLVIIPVKVVISGPYANVMAFVGAIQKGPRLYRVSLFSVTPYLEGVSAILEGKAYALPPAGGVEPSTVVVPAPETVAPAAPAPLPSDTPTEE